MMMILQHQLINSGSMTTTVEKCWVLLPVGLNLQYFTRAYQGIENFDVSLVFLGIQYSNSYKSLSKHRKRRKRFHSVDELQSLHYINR